jgi:hypothetical protein
MNFFPLFSDREINFNLFQKDFKSIEKSIVLVTPAIRIIRHQQIGPFGTK